MNWKEISETCPKAFLEWAKKELTLSGDATSAKFDSIVDTNESEYLFKDNTGYYFIVDTDEARVLPYYFDQFGICISVSYYMFSEDETDRFISTSTLVEGYDLNKFVSNGHFPDRLTATIAGAAKAFEIRDQQLNELNDNPLPLPK